MCYKFANFKDFRTVKFKDFHTVNVTISRTKRNAGKRTSRFPACGGYEPDDRYVS